MLDRKYISAESISFFNHLPSLTEVIFCLYRARGEPRFAPRPGWGIPSRNPRRARAYYSIRIDHENGEEIGFEEVTLVDFWNKICDSVTLCIPDVHSALIYNPPNMYTGTSIHQISRIGPWRNREAMFMLNLTVLYKLKNLI